METAYVCLGKAGDVLSAVAIAQQQADPVNLVVSRQYAPVARGLSHVIAHEYDGDWDDLGGAIKWAKRKFKKVLVPQVFGKDFPIQHQRPSFQLDAALRCNFSDFTATRLAVDISDPEGLVKAHLPAGPVILLADHSESSMFHQRHELFDLLVAAFPSHTVVRLHDIKVDKLSDFVALYDAADAVVTIDTAHLHLTSATRTPVAALVSDSPNRWRGSAWHPRFVFYGRYGDYNKRKDQLVAALKVAIEKRSAPVLTIIPTAHANAYNPSIVNWDGRIIRAYRYHPDPKLWPTTIAVEGIPVVFPDRLANHSIDDPRLFVADGKLHMSYVVTPYPVPSQPAPCAVGHGSLEFRNGVWHLTSHVQINYGKNNLTGQEKNFVFFQHAKDLYCIYACSPEHVVLDIHGAQVHREYRTPAPECSFGPMRGGTQPLPYQGQWLRFFHTLVKTPKNEAWWMYHIGALLMEKEPPFRITAVSRSPVLSGDERYFDNWKFWKPNVTICYGAIEIDGGWRVSVGVNDSACADVVIRPEHLNL